MTLDKRKIKKFQKLSMWILFLCVMAWIFAVSALRDAEKDLFLGTSLIFFVVSFIIVVVDMLAMFVIQMIIETKIKGFKAAVWSLMKDFLIYFCVGVLVIVGLTFFRNETFHIGLLWRILRFGLIAGVGYYMGRFWTLKISDDETGRS